MKELPINVLKFFGVNISTCCKFLNLHNLYDDIIFKKRRSHYEDEIINWIKTFYTKPIIPNYREPKKYEIDVFIPEISFGIEFNGTYWHSIEIKGSKYHYNKTKYFKNLGIQLFHIYEYEWCDPKIQFKIKQYLKSIILNNYEVIGARHCQIREVSTTEIKEFLNNYHFQNNIGAKIKLGLYYKDELIQVMTFGKPRYNKNYEWELLRLCTKFSYKVIGGTEKLFKYFIDNYNPKSVISYCDLDKFTGNIYSRLGMEKTLITSINYKWINLKTNEVLTRYKTQRHLLNETNKNLSELDIMRYKGYVKIENSGTDTYIWKLN